MLRLKRRNIWDHYCLVQHTSAVANYEYFKGLSITRLRAHTVMDKHSPNGKIQLWKIAFEANIYERVRWEPLDYYTLKRRRFALPLSQDRQKNFFLSTSSSCPVCVFFVHSSAASRWKPNCATLMFGKAFESQMHWHRHVFVAQMTVTSLLFEDFWHYARVFFVYWTILPYFICIYMYPFRVCMCVLLQNFDIDFGSETEPIPRDYTDKYMCDAFSTQISSLTLTWKPCDIAHPQIQFFCKNWRRSFVFGNDCFWGCATQLHSIQLIPWGSYVCSYARVI